MRWRDWKGVNGLKCLCRDGSDEMVLSVHREGHLFYRDGQQFYIKSRDATETILSGLPTLEAAMLAAEILFDEGVSK